MEKQSGANYDALADARARTAVQEVELPGFGDGRPWRVRLRRVSLLGLAHTGKIPNGLMAAVSDLYQHGVCRNTNLTQAADTMYLMAGEALAEPTLAQLEDSGVTLTDEQLTAIYLYAQRGVDALRPFRAVTTVSGDCTDGAAISAASQRAAGDQ